MSKLYIEAWNHGKAGDPETPCGELDFFMVSGTIRDNEIEYLQNNGLIDDIDLSQIKTESVVILAGSFKYDCDDMYFQLDEWFLGQQEACKTEDVE